MHRGGTRARTQVRQAVGMLALLLNPAEESIFLGCQNITAADQTLCRHGEATGKREGRELGIQKGMELAAEVGYYSGCAQVTSFAFESSAARKPPSFG